MLSRALLSVVTLLPIACGPSVSITSDGEAGGATNPEGVDATTGSTSGAEVTSSASSWESMGVLSTSGASGSSSSDASSGTSEPPPWRWSEGCIEGVDGPPVDASMASELLHRLLHEGTHHAQRVQAHAAAMDELGTVAFDYDNTTNDGALAAAGLVTLEPFGSFSSEHEVEFVCYTGGHGGFGPVALDGRVEVVVVVVADAAVVDFSATVSGEIRLGGGDAFAPTSPVAVSLQFTSVAGQETASGEIGEHDAGAL